MTILIIHVWRTGNVISGRKCGFGKGVTAAYFAVVVVEGHMLTASRLDMSGYPLGTGQLPHLCNQEKPASAAFYMLWLPVTYLFLI